MPLNPLYSMSKAGVINLVRSMAPVLAKASIQINALAPNLIGKPWSSSQLHMPYSADSEKSGIGTPLRLTDLDIATKESGIEFYKSMEMTPMSTVLRGFAKLLEDRTLTGQVAETSGDEVTLRHPPDYVDVITRKNFEKYTEMGISCWESD